MGRKSVIVNDRARQVLAQEAARIICEQGIEDYRTAKIKAAERLGMTEHGSLPGNAEIERAVGEHLLLFGGESHDSMLKGLRRAAVSAMELLAPFRPRLVGPVLSGTAGATSAVNLHVFADNPEQVAFALDEGHVAWRSYERRLKSRRDRVESFAGYRFLHDEAAVEATVFPVDGIRQAPISPIDGKPMQRADRQKVRRLIDGVDSSSDYS